MHFLRGIPSRDVVGHHNLAVASGISVCAVGECACWQIMMRIVLFPRRAPLIEIPRTNALTSAFNFRLSFKNPKLLLLIRPPLFFLFLCHHQPSFSYPALFVIHPVNKTENAPKMNQRPDDTSRLPAYNTKHVRRHHPYPRDKMLRWEHLLVC
jgi:hypothetical protein